MFLMTSCYEGSRDSKNKLWPSSETIKMNYCVLNLFDSIRISSHKSPQPNRNKCPSIYVTCTVIQTLKYDFKNSIQQPKKPLPKHCSKTVQGKRVQDLVAR